MEVSETAGVASDMADLYATKEVSAAPLPYGRGSEKGRVRKQAVWAMRKHL